MHRRTPLRMGPLRFRDPVLGTRLVDAYLARDKPTPLEVPAAEAPVGPVVVKS